MRKQNEPIEYNQSDLQSLVNAFMQYLLERRGERTEMYFRLTTFRDVLLLRTDISTRYELSRFHSIGLYWSTDKVLTKFQKDIINFGIKVGAFQKNGKRGYVANFQ